MFCIFHKWKIVESYITRDVSLGEPGFKTTSILKRCSKCQKIKVSRIDGAWQPKDIKGK